MNQLESKMIKHEPLNKKRSSEVWRKAGARIAAAVPQGRFDDEFLEEETRRNVDHSDVGRDFKMK